MVGQHGTESTVMNLPHLDISVKAGMLGGTLLSILANIHYSDVLKTSILAAIGAVVGFLVTILLKFLIKRIKRIGRSEPGELE